MTGLLRGCPVLLLAAVLAIPSGLGAALGSLVLLVAGFLVVGVALATWDAPAAAPARLWTEPALLGVLLGLLPVLAWAITGGPGWTARLAVFSGTGLWVAAASGQRPAVAFGALLAFLALGYTTMAGILYYLGQPLAFVALLAGRAARSHAGRAASGQGWGLESTAYLIAGVALVLSAWVDLV